MKIAIADYGMGNVKSIFSTLKYLGVSDIVLTDNFDELYKADKIILPGVGSFAKAMKHIKEKKIDQYLSEIVLKDKKPLLGICLGMQLLGKSSTEDVNSTGLGFVDAKCIKFESKNLKIPHVGFNQVQISNRLMLYDGLNNEADFYFTHSYKMISDGDINQNYCDYGGKFVASFEINNIAGVQFHPELSQNNGLKLLKNFIEKF